MPHWLNAGATQSGKSNLANAIIKGLAPQPVALVGFDLKGGVEFTPYAPRLSALATTRVECVGLLDDLVADRHRPDGALPRRTARATSGSCPSTSGRCRSWSWSTRSPNCS